MYKFKTNTIKSILEPVTQQIADIVTIGDYIDRGIKIPDLPEKILHMVDTTSHFMNVLDKIVSKCDDKIFFKTVKEFSLKTNESLNNLIKAAQIFKNDHNCHEGVPLLAAGANGVLDNVIHILSGYDDTFVRKIDHHLVALAELVERNISWSYEEINEFARTLQPHLIEVLKLLKPRIADIISNDISFRVKILIDELTETMVNLMSVLKELVEKEGDETQFMFVNKSSLQKYRLYKIIAQLRVLIWVDDLTHGDIEVFSFSLPYLLKFTLTWLDATKKVPTLDSSGKHSAHYILSQCEKYINQKHLKCQEILVTIQETRQNLNLFVDCEQFNISTSESVVSSLINQLNTIKNSFLTSYEEWSKKSCFGAKSSDIFSIDMSSFVVYEEWKESLEMICEASNTLCELAPDVHRHAQVSKIISELYESANHKSLKQEFATKGAVYHEINSKIIKLCSDMSQLTCDKNLTSIYNLRHTIDDFQEKLNILYNSASPNEQLVSDSSHSKLNLCRNIDTLKHIALSTTNSYPVPIDSIFRIEKSLENLQLLKDSLSQAHDQLLKSPSSSNLKSKIDHLIMEIQENADQVQKEILALLPHENVIAYSNEGIKNTCTTLLESLERNDCTQYQQEEKKIEFLLTILADKLLFESHNSEDTGAKQKFETQALSIKKAKENLSTQNEVLLTDKFNPNLFPMVISSAEDAKSTVEEIASAAQIPLNETIHKKSNIPVVEVEIPQYTVPDKYKQAHTVIEHPQSDDRIAVAASELHRHVYSKPEKSTLSDIVIETSYMFAEMSRLFKDCGKHSEMIDIGKNIALNTQSIIATAKKILLQCTDKRLKQILSSAIDKLPTISQQLKIMSTLRASRMKAMGGKVTKETDDANQMLVDCAENLMNVIVDVLKAAESASIKAKSVAKVDYSDV